MDITWLDPDHLDERAVAGVVSVLAAVRAIEAPYLPGETVSSVTARLRYGSDGDPPLIAVARDPSGRVAGMLWLGLPRWDNTHLASLRVVVDPAMRRRGVGTALFDAGLARAEGRRLVSSWSHQGGPGVEFLKARGFTPGLEIALRRLDLTALDWPRLAELNQEAERHAAGYELVRLPGAVPEELLPAVAEMTAAINDAPIGDLEIEDEVFPPERIRAIETAELARGLRTYRLVARERATGELAGQTVASADRERPWFGDQGDTSVVRAHRGRRLGLFLKIGMLRWLREVEPQLRTIDTDNAASNAHMIRINELLGFEVTGWLVEFQRPR